MMDRRMFITIFISFGLFIMLYIWSGLSNKMNDDVVNVYMSRKEILLKDLFQEFEKDTGIRVNYVHDSDASKLIERIKREDMDCPADLFLTADVINLVRAKKYGLTKAIHNEILHNNIPANLRDDEDHWYGLTTRARIIIYAKDKVSENELQYLHNYEDLANPIWKNRIIMRSSNSVYNQSLLASIIAYIGNEKSESWVQGLVANFTRDPRGGDIDQIKALAAGESDISVVNTYYLARMISSQNKDDREIASKIGVIFPNQNNRGTHVNISGMSLLKYAKHLSNAERLMEFLISCEAQKIYANNNNEYPIAKCAQWSDVLQQLGEFNADAIPLSSLEESIEQSVKIMNDNKWH